MDLFKITAAVMHWGNQKWKQKPREEQAEVDGPEDITKVSQLLGTEVDSFINGLLKPRIKVILKSNLFKKKSFGNQFKLI
jgi:myosin heavy chain 6/7